MDKNVIYVTSPDQIPQCEHWAIIDGSSVTIPGDERSRTNPGHGYPESTERYITYIAYLVELDFKTALVEELSSKYKSSSVRGIHVQGVYESKLMIELVKNTKYVQT